MNLSAMIKSMGVSNTVMTDDPKQFAEALKNKTRFVHYMIQAGNDKLGGEIPLKAMAIKQRFMQAVGSKELYELPKN